MKKFIVIRTSFSDMDYSLDAETSKMALDARDSAVEELRLSYEQELSDAKGSGYNVENCHISDGHAQISYGCTWYQWSISEIEF